MDITAIIFYFIASVMIVFSVLAVTSRRILRAAVYLLFALAGTAALYFMIDYFFLAAVQLIVYAGGIVVLIIFSVLLTSHINEKLEKPAWSKIIFTTLTLATGLVLTLYTIYGHSFVTEPASPVNVTMNLIGERMLSYSDGGYVLPFEVISILLLAAMVSAIVIAKRTPPKS